MNSFALWFLSFHLWLHCETFSLIEINLSAKLIVTPISVHIHYVLCVSDCEGATPDKINGHRSKSFMMYG